ncbi:MAG: 5-formyltetrahydrofolate cyclo-ligase [Lishizhenia sp.]
MSTKDLLRKQAKEERKAISPKALQIASEAITERVLTKFQLEGKMCSLFLPIERQKEINTYVLLERARNFGAKFTVPQASFKTMALKHFVFTDETVLEVNKFGIPEPVKGKKIAADKHDIVFVPLLGADKKGNRVGYGKGFYDRFLAKCSPHCTFIGLSIFEPINAISDVVSTDKRLNYLVTPTKVYSFDK